MWDVEKKWRVCVVVDEFDGSLGVLGRQLLLILPGNVFVDGLVALDQGEWRIIAFSFWVISRQINKVRMVGPHVIGVRKPKVMVKPVLQWKELFVVSKMPFPETRSGVIFLFKQLRNCHLTRINAVSRCRTERT